LRQNWAHQTELQKGGQLQKGLFGDSIVALLYCCQASYFGFSAMLSFHVWIVPPFQTFGTWMIYIIKKKKISIQTLATNISRMYKVMCLHCRWIKHLGLEAYFCAATLVIIRSHAPRLKHHLIVISPFLILQLCFSTWTIWNPRKNQWSPRKNWNCENHQLFLVYKYNLCWKNGKGLISCWLLVHMPVLHI